MNRVVFSETEIPSVPIVQMPTNRFRYRPLGVDQQYRHRVAPLGNGVLETA